MLANLASQAADQLEANDIDPKVVTSFRTAIDDLVADDNFWERQVDSLAVFADLDRVETYRLPNQLTEAVEVSDRFHLAPLLRAVTFPQAAYVLALAQGAVRLLEITADQAPEEVHVPDLPKDAWDSGGNHFFKSRDRAYVRDIDHALRPVIGGSDLPLIIAATEAVAALFRTVNTYPHLADTRWPGNPEEASDADLATHARTILDELYVGELTELKSQFDLRASQDRAATDLSDVARMATFGQVDTVLVDMDASVPGSIDETSGAISFADEASAASYDVVDEIARRVRGNGGRVLAVRRADVPHGGDVAAILRFAG